MFMALVFMTIYFPHKFKDFSTRKKINLKKFHTKTTALSFKISRTIPKYPYFIGDIPPICPRKS
jgi:hypothetical protein